MVGDNTTDVWSKSKMTSHNDLRKCVLETMAGFFQVSNPKP